MKNSIIKGILLICTLIFLVMGALWIPRILFGATLQLRERAAATTAVLLVYATAFLISFILSLVFLRER
ncbi:MAG: hypothetical protein ACFE9Z_04365 [Promethearchaeota archaeon]